MDYKPPIEKSAIPKPDWKDFGWMDSIYKDRQGKTLMAVNVDINKTDDPRWLRNHYKETFERTHDSKLWHSNNSVLALVEKDAGGATKLQLASLTGLSEWDSEQLVQELQEKGYRHHEMNVPHSSDGGAWIAKAQRFGESLPDYEKRLAIL